MKRLTKSRIEISLMFILFTLILPAQYKIFDFEFWKDWAIYMHRYGLVNIYHHPTAVYHPVILYIIKLYTWVQGSEEDIIKNINYLKLFVLPFDFLPIIVLCCFKPKLITAKIPYLLLFLNAAYLYNTLVWGQMDSVYICFVFLAVVFSFSYPITGSMLFAIALATKPQALIFFPYCCLSGYTVAAI